MLKKDKKKKKEFTEASKSKGMSAEILERDGVIDQEAISEADRVVSIVANKNRNKKKKDTSHPKDVYGSKPEVKFGYIEETVPAEDLSPLFTDDELTSKVPGHPEPTNTTSDTDDILSELTPIDVARNDYASASVEEKPENIKTVSQNSEETKIDDFNTQYNQDIVEPLYDKPKKPKKKNKKEPKMKVQKERKGLSFKTIFNIVIISVLFVSCVVLVYPKLKTSLDNRKDPTVTNTVGTFQPGNNENTDNTVTKLEAYTEGSPVSVEDTLTLISQFNSVVGSYLNETVMLIDGCKTDEIKTVENELKVIKGSIQADIVNVESYYKVFEEYGSAEVVNAVKERLDNAYMLADTTKNVMTEKAMVNNTNFYIERDQELVRNLIHAIATHLDANEIPYKLTENGISY